MTESGQKYIAEIFLKLGTILAQGGLAVTSPSDGAPIASLAQDDPQSLQQKIGKARQAQQQWSQLRRAERVACLEKYAAALKEHRDALATLIVCEGGKTSKEALGEIDGSADIILKTIKDATLPELNGMLRTKERPPVGLVGLITSFNFPAVVAHWTLAPALLTGNAVLWKPSEKTPLVALACKAVFDKAMGTHAGLLHILIGGRDIGEQLVAHEQVDMISATGSVPMGQAIKATLARKKNNAVRPILELGGNNGVIISHKISKEHLEWSLSALMNSFLGTSGQRCTNTRRLIVHKSLYDEAVDILKQKIEQFLASGALQSPNDYGYGALIDEDAFERFEQAKAQAVEEGGKLLFGGRLLKDKFAQAYYVEPTLALMPRHTGIMHKETFAPILFIAPYQDFEEALTMLNAPANAGLVGGIYTQNQQEADHFAAACEAGHALINSPKGTGTPAYGMGFGGNKESGTGEILNAADPLAPFTRPDKFTRIAQNKDVAMNQA